jgi:hypothetical protein
VPPFLCSRARSCLRGGVPHQDMGDGGAGSPLSWCRTRRVPRGGESITKRWGTDPPCPPCLGGAHTGHGRSPSPSLLLLPCAACSCAGQEAESHSRHAVRSERALTIEPGRCRGGRRNSELAIRPAVAHTTHSVLCSAYTSVRPCHARQRESSTDGRRRQLRTIDLRTRLGCLATTCKLPVPPT